MTVVGPICIFEDQSLNFSDNDHFHGTPIILFKIEYEDDNSKNHDEPKRRSPEQTSDDVTVFCLYHSTA